MKIKEQKAIGFKLLKKDRAPIERRVVQILFVLMILYIGIQFMGFVNSYADPNATVMVPRPSGVEAFLPISALVALKSWLVTGIFDTVHPAGLVILLLAMALSLVFKRSFCSWICPIGTLSEGLAVVGRKLFGKNFVVPRWLDYPLRSIKYILLSFFIVFILIFMDGASAYGFLQTPYNMIADVKMLDFFKNLTGVGITVIAVLALLSLLFQNFWCRYLCPYGALMSLLSILSPWKIRRNADTCISCQKCTAVCPNQLKVAEAKSVWSPECSGCLNCVKSCPVKGTLEFSSPASRGRGLILDSKGVAIAIVVIWFMVVALAKFTGHWETSIPPEMYKILIPQAGQFNH
ncbi:polyferredoxin [Desulfitobacterium dichloroeliminans LMG P-21439]|uniref:Polyferredoxin n=1 Tax=Desulfitobacterium dichloroeliminans (strain LMG P-21439 / DCA1) TaxID=871963 RepID=L0F3M4_DESDL|nr:polyferredoxin [Desulfitobacterium dichloroeliminans LMG P-21439]